MATARSKLAAAPPPKASQAGDPMPWPLRACDAIYRFLASLRLAVMLIATLASVLAFATFYEKWNGTRAVQIDIYQSKGFALLLAMLGVNILCAALIRFPWKRRQTGFVITHSGLLILLLGSFLSIQHTDNGQVQLIEGRSTRNYLRPDFPIVRVEKLDPHTGRVVREFAPMAFQPGAQPWESERRARLVENPAYVRDKMLERTAAVLLAVGCGLVVVVLAARRSAWVARPAGALVVAGFLAGALLSAAYAWFLPVGPRREVLSDAHDPFRLVVKDYLPSATEPHASAVAMPGGVPMLRAALFVQPPGAPAANDALDGHGWIAAARDLGHGVLRLRPLDIHFQHLSGPHAAQALENFLHPPKDPKTDRLARIAYVDSSGKPRVYEWRIGADEGVKLEGGAVVREGRTVALPDSDLTVTLVGVIPMPTRGEALQGLGPRAMALLAAMGEAAGATEIPAAAFKVRQGSGPEVTHIGWANLPMAPNLFDPGRDDARPLVWIDYYHPPELTGGGAGMQGRFGVVEVVATEDGRMFYRAFGRSGLKGPAPVQAGEVVPLFGGDQMPMKVSLRIDEFLPEAEPREVCDPLDLPPNERDKAIPAALVAFSTEGHSREVWLPLADRQLVELPDGLWRIALEPDQRPLGFEIELIDFEPSNDPGTTSRSAYRSDVVVRGADESPARPSTFAALADKQAFLFPDRPREALRKAGGDGYQPFDGGEVVKVEDPKTSVRPLPEPAKITMNNPLKRGSWTIYQSEYAVVPDAEGQPTGLFRSILSVRNDPVWPVVYGGCLVIVVGIFVQFFMRAGVFSDGGRRERERAEARQQRHDRREARPVGVGRGLDDEL
jgi:hypothetical protein